MKAVEKAQTSTRWIEEDKELATRFTAGVTAFWRIYEEPPRPIECRVWFLRESEGFSAILPDLPGTVSQGDSLEHAEVQVREAIAAALAVYREAGSAIPWESSKDVPPTDTIERWIVVDG